MQFSIFRTQRPNWNTNNLLLKTKLFLWVLWCCVLVQKTTQSSHKIYLVNIQRSKERTKHIFIIINNGIIMENTALNGTTVTKNQEEWKTKKGYGPIIVAVSLALLLGLSFYAGRHSDAMRMTNVVASSSSSSLVGSGTTDSPIYCTTANDCPQVPWATFKCENRICTTPCKTADDCMPPNPYRTSSCEVPSMICVYGL